MSAEAAAAIVTLAVVRLHFNITGQDLSLWIKLALAGAVAAGVGYLLRAAVAWIVLLALLPAMLVGALSLSLPNWVPILILIALVLLMRNSFGERVPLYLTNPETLGKIASLLPHDAPVRFIDLGCGLAAVPISLARYNTHPDSQFIGVENAPIPYLIARIMAWRAGDPRIRIRWGSLWHTNLGKYDCVYAFLSPQPMPDLFEKAQSEMRADGLFVSNSFEVPGHPPNQTIPIQSGRATSLMVWRPGNRHNQSIPE